MNWQIFFLKQCKPNDERSWGTIARLSVFMSIYPTLHMSPHIYQWICLQKKMLTHLILKNPKQKHSCCSMYLLHIVSQLQLPQLLLSPHCLLSDPFNLCYSKSLTALRRPFFDCFILEKKGFIMYTHIHNKMHILLLTESHNRTK